MYKRQAKCDGMGLSGAKHLKALEEKYRRLKKCMAEKVMEESLSELGDRDEGLFAAPGLPIGGACAQGLPVPVPVVMTMVRLAPFFVVCRVPPPVRLSLPLKRESVLVNSKKLSRIYQAERLTDHKRSGRMRALGTRSPIRLAQARNLGWSLDFVSETLTECPPLRILAVVPGSRRGYVAVGCAGRA